MVLRKRWATGFKAMVSIFASLLTFISVGNAQATPVSIEMDPSGTVTVMAKTSVVVTKGTLGTRTTSDAQVTGQQKHVDAYAGPTTFKANWTIVFMADGKTVDPTKSSVSFVTVNYTSGTKLVNSNFTTPAIKITSAMLNGDGSVASFTFEGTDWYDPKDGFSGSVINKGISGSINLGTGASSYTAAYQYKPNASINTYTVMSMAGGGRGAGRGAGAKPGDDFAPAAPEPATWAMFMIGISGLWAQAQSRRIRVRNRV